MSPPIYATLQQLANKLGIDDVADLPADSQEKLRMASRDVDDVLIGAVYATDINEIPIDINIMEAMKNATLAQGSYWLDRYGAEHGPTAYSNVSIGSVTLGARATGQDGDIPNLAPQALKELRQVGLLPVYAKVRG